MPIEGECNSCDGFGCEECEGTGRIKITCCPLEFITWDVWELIALAELFEKGLPPVAGGVLDQAKNFIDAARFVFNEQQYYKKKLRIME